MGCGADLTSTRICAILGSTQTKETKMRKKNKPNLVKAGGGMFMLNQHAPRYADKRTKRNRDKATQKRNAIAEQVA